MRLALTALATTMAAALTASVVSAQAPSSSAPQPFANATLKNGQGATVGTAVFREGPSGVLVRIEGKGLPAGWHGAHFHAVGDCSDPKFEKAGAHINHAEAKKPHGLLNPQGPDFGDLPNIHVDATGAVAVELFSALVSADGDGGRPGLLGGDGSSLLVHANPDDHITQPIGGAGARIACGVITAAR